MLRSNTKKVKERIRSFINSIFDASSYDREDLNNASIEEKIHFIALICCKELGHEVKRGASYREMFVSWCQGLPSLIDTASYYCHASAVDLLGDMLEQTQKERSKYTEPEAERMISYLIYKEVANDLFKIAY